MAPDWSEVEAELQRRSHDSQALSRDPLALLAAQARGSHFVALKLEELLKDDAWNMYVAHLKAIQEADETEADRWRRELETPGQSGDQLSMIQQQLQRVLGRLERGRQAMELPQTVIDRDQVFQQAAEKLLDTAGSDAVVPNGE